MDREVETASLLIAGLADAQRRNSVRSALEAVIPRGRHATTPIRQPISAERQPGL